MLFSVFDDGSAAADTSAACRRRANSLIRRQKAADFRHHDDVLKELHRMLAAISNSSSMGGFDYGHASLTPPRRYPGEARAALSDILMLIASR